MTVRAEFDDYCLKRTVERGAEFAVIPHIHAITQTTDGVAVETAAGTLHGGYVIGADGANSVVRRLVPGFPAPIHGFAIEAQVPVSDPPPMEFDFGVAEFGYGWLFPKRDHVNVGLYTNAPDVRLSRAALEQYARAKLGSAALDHVVGHRIGLHGWDGKCAEDRVLLVGDAAGLVDPLLGEGIHNAVVSGQAAAQAISSATDAGIEAATAYHTLLQPMLHDLREAYGAATRFYHHIGIGYRVLRFAFVRSALMKAYARGLTFSSARRRFLVLPFLPG
jgi:flavin-dependent dehydrogenase